MLLSVLPECLTTIHKTLTDSVCCFQYLSSSRREKNTVTRTSNNYQTCLSHLLKEQVSGLHLICVLIKLKHLGWIVFVSHCLLCKQGTILSLEALTAYPHEGHGYVRAHHRDKHRRTNNHSLRENLLLII